MAPLLQTWTSVLNFITQIFITIGLQDGENGWDSQTDRHVYCLALNAIISCTLYNERITRALPCQSITVTRCRNRCLQFGSQRVTANVSQTIVKWFSWHMGWELIITAPSSADDVARRSYNTWVGGKESHNNVVLSSVVYNNIALSDCIVGTKPKSQQVSTMVGSTCCCNFHTLPSRYGLAVGQSARLDVSCSP